ncbi:MAG: zf-HC2 domain-containing protein [Candidatus Dormibacteria bacterium]
MKCSLLTLSCALDGELSRERQSELEAHLVTCERCRTGMRYLRDETDRISQLARVAVSGGTATALLERARVVVTPGSEPEEGGPAAEESVSQESADSADSTVEPFSMMGIGTQIIPIEKTTAGGADSEAPDPGEQPPSSLLSGGDHADMSTEVTGPGPSESDEPLSDVAETADSEQGVTSPFDEPAAAEPEAADAVGTADGTSDEARPAVSDQPDHSPTVLEAGGAVGLELNDVSAGGEIGTEASGAGWQEESPADTTGTSPAGEGGQPGLGLSSPSAVESPSWDPNPADASPGSETHDPFEGGDRPSAVEQPQEPWLSSSSDSAEVDSSGTDVYSRADDVEIPVLPEWPAVPATDDAEPTPEQPWLASSSAADPQAVVDSTDDPPPLFVPFRIESQDPQSGGAPAVSWPPAEELAAEELTAEGAESTSNPLSPQSSTTRQSDEVMQVALEESALLGELSTLDRFPAQGPVAPVPGVAEPAIPPPPSISNLPGNQGWEPSPSLNLGLDEIATAQTLDLIGSKPKPAVEIPPSLQPSAEDFPRGSRAAARPADSVAPLARPATSGRLEAGGHSTAPPRRSREPRSATAGAPPRSWTKTATIAVAALAVFLIGWSLLHHSTKPATAPSTHHHAIVPVQSKPTPTQQPTAPTQPAVTLTNSQTFGGTGSGYQVQGVRYGLHQSNTQLWVVFQLVQGSGAPKVTVGFASQTSLYLEMSGVAAGATVAQPAPGGLITTVTPTQVPGFSGAAYVLQLSRTTKIDSAYLLPGSETSSAGERVVLELQN